MRSQMRCLGGRRATTRAMSLHTSLRTSSRNPQCRRPICVVARQKEANPITLGVVFAATEALRLLGVGRRAYQRVAQAPEQRPLRKGDVRGVMRRITRDFRDNAYFVTGVIDGSIYEADCLFADPTIAFRGLDLWRRNLQLLVPFLIEPQVELKGLRRAGREPQQGREVLQADWVLQTGFKLPWRVQPLVLKGSTEYILNEDANKVAEHVETWTISGTQALLQLFRPYDDEGGQRRKVRQRL